MTDNNNETGTEEDMIKTDNRDWLPEEVCVFENVITEREHHLFYPKSGRTYEIVVKRGGVGSYRQDLRINHIKIVNFLGKMQKKNLGRTIFFISESNPKYRRFMITDIEYFIKAAECLKGGGGKPIGDIKVIKNIAGYTLFPQYKLMKREKVMLNAYRG